MVSKIQILPTEVVHLMAAGEVIDSLAAVVRELAENAIDAHATRVTISLWPEQWQIRLADNGDGMTLADLEQAALPHSTSKIQHRQDLWQINSLGFRGEALHSLAQLADLEICSRLMDAPEGSLVRYDRQGNPHEVETVAIAPGTVITASRLFENWPSRRQSLPAIAQQLRAVQLTIQHLALCHPQITWQVEQSDRPWFAIWSGTSAQQILPQILREVQVADLREWTDEKVGHHPWVISQADDSLQDPSQKLLKNPLQYSLQDSSQDALQDSLKNPLQYSLQDSSQDSLKNLVQNPSQDLLKNSLQNSLQGSLQDSSENSLQNPPQDSLENSLQNPLQETLQNPLQKPLQESLQDASNRPLQNSLQDSSKNLLQNPLRDSLKSPLPDLLPNSLKSPLPDSLPNSLKDSLPDSLPDSLKSPLPDSLPDSLPRSLPDSLTSSLTLLLGLPDRCHRHRPDWIKVAVNGRVVRVPEFEQTIMGRLRRVLPRDRHPICFLHVHLPAHLVDWNRHPAKAEIYIQDIANWQTRIVEAIDKTLQLNQLQGADSVYQSRIGSLIRVAEAQGGYRVSQDGASLEPEASRFSEAEEILADSSAAIAPPPTAPPQQTLKALTQVHQMYILAEHSSGMWLVEQHIAHERVLYEQLRDRWQPIPVEPPIILNHLTESQVTQLKRIGLDIEPFGEMLWAVRTVPEPLASREDCAEALWELSLGGDLESALVATACRTAIRNGTPLSLAAMQSLLDQWLATRNPRTCPHGRPIYLPLEESSLSRFFRRHWVIGKSHGI